MTNSSKRVILVAGMHRGGTSALARALPLLGAGLGANLLAPNPVDNRRGFFEDVDVKTLNENLLKVLGHDWHTLGRIDDLDLNLPEVARLRRRASAILRAKLDAEPLFGLKDPRISRVMPFWNDVFARLKAAPGYVIAYRNPRSVAR